MIGFLAKGTHGRRVSDHNSWLVGKEFSNAAAPRQRLARHSISSKVMSEWWDGKVRPKIGIEAADRA